MVLGSDGVPGSRKVKMMRKGTNITKLNIGPISRTSR